MTDTAAASAEALRLASVEPLRAIELATEVLADHGSTHLTTSAALQAVGLARRELGELAASSRALRRSIDAARRAVDQRREAEVRVSLALNQAMAGRTPAALSSLDEAEAQSPAVRAVASAQRALILMRAGRFADALDAFEVAVMLARTAGAREDEAKLLNNRALLHCWRGNTTAAEHDLHRAEQLAVELDDALGVASARHNLGWILGRRGDIPAALAALDAAEAAYLAIGVEHDALPTDRAELLLSARLVDEALEATQRAVDHLRRKGLFADVAVARIQLAEAQRLAGRTHEARATAALALRSFRADGRAGWAALARDAVVRAKVARSVSPTAALQGEVLATAEELEAAGWALPALDARLTAARLAWARGDGAAVADAVAGAGAARAKGRPADLRIRAWHAEALARLVQGDRTGAAAALRRGLRVLDEHRAVLGATELRAHAGGHAEALTGLGVQLAVEDGRPHDVLAWAESQRAQALRFRPVRPPADPELTAALAALRGVRADLDAATAEGDDGARLRTRRLELEREISARTRRVTGDGVASGPWSSHHAAALRRNLGPRAALVSYVEDGDRLLAVVVDDRRATLHPLGTTATVAAEVDGVAFALRRLARPGLPAAARAAARASLVRAGAALDEVLLEPLGRRVGHRQLVVVPTGVLHGLAWSVLPSMQRRPLTVVPSAAVWLDAVARRNESNGSGRVAVVAGPGLAAADEEAVAVAAIHPDSSLLPSAEATGAAVLRAIDGASLAHLATHGRFRADNPLFSSLLLADGPLVAHDLTALAVAPSCVVLSACESATSGRTAGDDLLGMLAVLFSLGTRSVVASLVLVPDDATARLMVDMHRGLAAGRPLAVALSEGRDAALVRGGDDDLVAALGFNAYGDALDRV